MEPPSSAPARSRRDSVGSSSGRKRRKHKAEPTSTVRVVLSTLMVYLSYQILTREDDDIAKTNLHIPHLDLGSSQSSGWPRAGGNGHQGGSHASFPDPYGLGHQIAGMGSNLLHHGNIHSAPASQNSTDLQSPSLIMRVLRGLAVGIYSVFTFIYRSLNSTLLLILSLAYYLASPLTSIFFTLTKILLSPANTTWGAIVWVWEPVGKWIGGFVLTGLGLGAGLAWIGHHVESFFKGRIGSRKERLKDVFVDSWLGRVFGMETGDGEGAPPFEGFDQPTPYAMTPAATSGFGRPQDYRQSQPFYTYPTHLISPNPYPPHIYAGPEHAYALPQPAFYPQPILPSQYLPHGSRRKSESSRRLYLAASARRAGPSRYDAGEMSLSSPESSESELDPEAILLGRKTRRRTGSDIARQVDMIDPPTSASSRSVGSSRSGTEEESPTRASGRPGRNGAGGSLSKRAAGKRAKAIHFHFHPGSPGDTLRPATHGRKNGEQSGDEDDGRSHEDDGDTLAVTSTGRGDGQKTQN